MILYPTETIYGLGVNALDDAALGRLFALKGRDERQTVSWAVRHLADIEYYAEVSPVARQVIERWLPGSLTVVLPAKATVPIDRAAPDRTIGFRILPDPAGRQVVEDFMATYEAPLTCTSANVSGHATESTPKAILAQFGERAAMIETVYDDGPRQGVASTVVKIEDAIVTVLREGALREADIRAALPT